MKKGNDEGVEEGLKGLKQRIEHSIKLAKEKTINDKSLAYKLQRELCAWIAKKYSLLNCKKHAYKLKKACKVLRSGQLNCKMAY